MHICNAEDESLPYCAKPLLPETTDIGLSGCTKALGYPELSEKWVQARIAEDPINLGLGDLILKGLIRQRFHHLPQNETETGAASASE